VVYTALDPQFEEVARWRSELDQTRLRRLPAGDSSPSWDIVSTLIASRFAWTPVVHDFGLSQTKEQRAAAIRALTREDRMAISDIFERHITHSWDAARVLTPTEREPEFFMSWTSDVPPDITGDELQYFSVDWRLRVFAGPTGTVYDFNGWPGDNECGGAVFYPADEGAPGREAGSAPGREGEAGGAPLPIDVFANSDEHLTPLHFEFRAMVAIYAREREEANRQTTREEESADASPGDEEVDA
jgi:hypothetical protein